MYLAPLFRFFRPLQNPLGFGVADFVLLAAALLLAAVIILRAALLPFLAKLQNRTPIALACLSGLAVALRLALLPNAPKPVPSGADDFSYILLADTLRHLRLANPPHPLHQFFEAVFILQQPTYSSIYPLGQGILLAFGRIVFQTYWAGVLLSLAAFCGLTFWMLRGWTSPRWAFLGGLLAIAQFGPLSAWTNSYWGGYLSACAGCLVFGALPRLRSSTSLRPALLLGIGLALQLLTRPFECLFLVLSVIAFCLIFRTKLAARSIAIVALALLPAVALTLLQNHSVTGSWRTLPYLLSRYQYGVPTTFTFQPNPIPHRPVTPEQDLDYRAQAAIHGSATDNISAYLGRLVFRIRFLRFFLLPPLYLAALFLLPSVRHRTGIWLLATLAFFFAGTNFYPYFFPHYIAAVTCLFLLVAVKGLESLSQIRINGFAWGRVSAQLLVALAGAHFLFWYLLHLSGNEQLQSAAAYETWDYLNGGDPEGRIAIAHALAQTQSRQLVFVRYAPRHRFSEWITNAADIDAAPVVWALDLGSSENEKLIHYFPARRTWLLEPDARPPKLAPYAEPVP